LTTYDTSLSFDFNDNRREHTNSVIPDFTHSVWIRLKYITLVYYPKQNSNLVKHLLSHSYFVANSNVTWNAQSNSNGEGGRHRSRRSTHIFCVMVCYRRQCNLLFKETSKISRIVREKYLKCDWSEETYFQLILTHLHMFGTVLWFEGWNSDRGNRLLSPVGPNRPLFNGYRCSFLGCTGRDVTLTIHLQLAPMLKMGAGTFLLLLYALIAWAGTFLSFVQYLDSITWYT